MVDCLRIRLDGGGEIMAKCRRSTPQLRAVRSIVISALFASAVGGCTAVKATIHMADAERRLNSAQEYGAQDMATYEYTMALRYLEKAKEEITYNEYRASENLSKKSQEWSDKAIIFIQRGGRMDLSGEEFGIVPEQTGTPTGEIPEEIPEVLAPGELPELPPETTGEELWEDTPDPEPAPEPKPAAEDEFDFDDDEDFDMEAP